MATKQIKQEEAAQGGLTDKFHQLRDYFEESKVEIKKVTWPTRKEVKVTTIAVLVLVVLMAIFLGLVDTAFVKLIEFISGLGR